MVVGVVQGPFDVVFDLDAPDMWPSRYMMMIDVAGQRRANNGFLITH